MIDVESKPKAEQTNSTVGGHFASASLSESSDIASSTFTTAVMSVGDSLTGRISSGADSDWIRVELVAGQSYVFTVHGSGGAVGLTDTTLTLRDAAGEYILDNDEINFNNSYSLINFTASETGTYYIDVGGWGSETGQYTLRMASDVFTPDDVASQLIDMFWGYNTAPLHFTANSGDTLTVNITGLTAKGQQLARWALEQWSATTGLLFEETTSSLAKIVFDDEEENGNTAGLFAYAGPSFANGFLGTYSQAKVFISRGWIQTEGTTFGSYGYLTYLHEIGHALGLGHAGFYDGFADYGFDNHYLNDSYQMTIMSYFDTVANTSIDATDFFPITPMIGDMAAIERLYGPVINVHTGDTIWGADSTVGGTLARAMAVMFDGAARPAWMDPVRAMGFTIVDTGGTDTMSFTKTSEAQVIDMRQGGISDVYGMTGTVVVAQGTVIENADGGDGADRIFGNGVGNTIRGNAGADRIDGLGGRDTIYGGDGADNLSGGDGNDKIWGGNAGDQIDGELGNDTMGGGAGNDRISDASGQNVLWGGAGNDTLMGGVDADRLGGGINNDSLDGGDGDDLIYGGGHDDWMEGGLGNDTLWGGNGNDTLWGGEGNDDLGSGGGDDTMTGGVGADDFIFYRENGADMIADFSAADGDGITLSRWLWFRDFGTLTAQEVEDRFGGVDLAGNVTLTFATAGTTVTIQGLTDLSALDQYITII